MLIQNDKHGRATHPFGVSMNPGQALAKSARTGHPQHRLAQTRIHPQKSGPAHCHSPVPESMEPPMDLCHSERGLSFAKRSSTAVEESLSPHSRKSAQRMGHPANPSGCHSERSEEPRACPHNYRPPKEFPSSLRSCLRACVGVDQMFPSVAESPPELARTDHGATAWPATAAGDNNCN